MMRAGIPAGAQSPHADAKGTCVHTSYGRRPEKKGVAVEPPRHGRGMQRVPSRGHPPVAAPPSQRGLPPPTPSSRQRRLRGRHKAAVGHGKCRPPPPPLLPSRLCHAHLGGQPPAQGSVKRGDRRGG